MIEIVLMILGIVLLIKGADFLVDGSSYLAKKFGVSKLVIGLTIVAFGTSLPELFVNIFASVNKQSDIVLGNIIGSNLSNIALILGLTAIIVGSIKIKQSTIWREIPYSIFSAIILLILSLRFLSAGATLSFIDGIILLVFFGLFLYYVSTLIIQYQKEPVQEVNKEENVPSNLKLTLMMVGGLIALFFGGRWTVSGAILIAQFLGLSEFVISATIIAIGTSLPELVTTIAAARKDSFDMAVGNIVGSNIFNILFVLGISSIINPIIVPSFIIVDIICLILLTGLLFLFMFTGKKHHIDRWEGLVLFILYIVYVIFILWRK